MTIHYRTFETDVKREWFAFLSGYFDGSGHAIAGETTVFPQCDVTFEREHLPRPLARPRINISFMPSPKQRLVSRNVTKFVVFQVIVYTTGENKEEHDKISGLLSLIFKECRDELAVSKMRITEIGNAIEFIDQKHIYFITSRLVTVRVAFNG